MCDEANACEYLVGWNKGLKPGVHRRYMFVVLNLSRNFAIMGAARDGRYERI